MDKELFSSPLPLGEIQVTDDFWKKEMELVRTVMIPYQWDALNDQVEGAAPSFCMHNFKVAGKRNEQRRLEGKSFQEPEFTNRGIEVLPEDLHDLKDEFYGFVFQDSDFYKWIEAVGYSLSQHPDAQLEAVADGAIDIVCAAQQEDGYLDTYYILTGKDRIFTDLRDRHELYCLGHLAEGAVAYYQATGKDKLLHAACRYADYVADHFGAEEGKCKGYPGHEIAEMALVRLYQTTGNEKYFRLAKYFIDERGTRPYYFDKEHPEAIKNGADGLRYEYNQAHLPVREQDEVVGHAVRAVYLYSGMTDIAKLTCDESLYNACEKLWENMVNKKLYITGGIGGTHIGESFSFNYDLPNDTAYAETCASIGLIFWARRMLEVRPDSRYADVMERALYNGVLSGMSLDGKSFFYVNPLEVLPEACHKDERKFHVKPVRQKWFGCACCPPNLARLLCSLGSYAYTKTSDTLFVHLYMGSDIRTELNGQDVTIRISSSFPWSGNVQIKVSKCEKPITLALRLPDWTKGEVTVNGLEKDPHMVKDGYLYLTKAWDDDETLNLVFPMKVDIWQSNSHVRENIGKVAVTRGPIVYCLEEADNGADLPLLTLDLDMISSVSEELYHICDESVISIVLPGSRQEASGDTDSLYHPASHPARSQTKLHFIPYYTWANRGENEMAVWVRMK